MPFSSYAIRNVLHHAEKAEIGGINQRHFLDGFPTERWNILDRWFHGNRYSSHSTTSLSYVLAKMDLTGLIRIESQNHWCFQVEREETLGTAFFAAMSHASGDTARALLEVLGGTRFSDLYKRRGKSEPGMYQFTRRFSWPARTFFFSQDRSVLSYIAEFCDSTVLLLYLDKAQEPIDFEATDNEGRTVLIWAATSGNTDTLEFLVRRNVNLETRDRDGYTAVSWAARGGHDAALRVLLESGASAEADDDHGRTPLSWAAGHFNVRRVIQLLLENGANIEAPDSSGRTPLSWAAAHGDEEAAQVLLENGADLEACDESGRTPLSWATDSRNDVVSQLLITYGANTEARDRWGLTPSSRATDRADEIGLRVLLENGIRLLE